MSHERPPFIPAGGPDPQVPSQALQHADDAGIEDLLREVGVRAEPGVPLADEVRKAVYAEWRDVVEVRQRRRRGFALALAAGVAGIVAATTVGLRANQPGSVPLATIMRIEGHPQVGTASGFHEAKPGEVLATGMRLQTPDSRVALSFGSSAANRISVRIDAGSQLRLLEKDRIELNAGALYVDAGAGVATRGVPLIVQTAAGSVRHVGTQYQVRTVGGSSVAGIEVSIREGRVEIASDYGTNTGVAGERVAVSTQGTVLRSALPADDASWQWAASVVPSFDIAGRSLSAFLEWVARETGRTLSYDSPAAKRAAEALELGGSIDGLEPNTALQAVLSTTKFTRVESRGASLRIALGRD